MNYIRPVFLMLAFTASMLFWAGIAVTPATATSIQYSFAGTVDHVSSPLRDTKGGLFNTSQLMSGSMTVDPGVASPGHPGTGTYTIQTFILDIGSYHATMGTSGQVEIRDRINGLDRFTATVNAPVGVPVTVNFLAPRLFDIQLRGPASIFSNDALPTTVPEYFKLFRLQSVALGIWAGERESGSR